VSWELTEGPRCQEVQDTSWLSSPRRRTARTSRFAPLPFEAWISVTFNARLLIAQLTYSLRTRCTPAELAYVVVVDSAQLVAIAYDIGLVTARSLSRVAPPTAALLNCHAGSAGDTVTERLSACCICV
jgi:hypothetical protein